MNPLFHSQSSENEDSHWLSVSDLMAGLMMVFMFIAVAFMRNADIERNTIKQVAVAYQENQIGIYNALHHEFKSDLKTWDATINKNTLTVTFSSPDVLFKTGKIELSKRYQLLLDDFFPRYLKVLDRFNSSINEIRIEGHTSSLWNQQTSEQDAYFKNMALSQGRTRSVLEYIYNHQRNIPYQQWIKSHIAAVGLSSSKSINNPDGKENHAKSRRVSFRVITNAETEIKRILETS